MMFSRERGSFYVSCVPYTVGKMSFDESMSPREDGETIPKRVTRSMTNRETSS